MRDEKASLDRRRFLKGGITAAAGAAAWSTGLAGAAASGEKSIRSTGSIPTRRFGKTGHQLPVLGMGGSALIDRWVEMYNVPEIAREERVKMIRHGYDSGIRYFDTARGYADSESMMGEALEDVRDNVYLATKSAARGADQVKRDVETSLKELRTDYLDAVQIHTPSRFEPSIEALEVLEKFRDEGVIRFIGVTTHVHFENIHRLISTGRFDQVLLAYGYFRKGMVKLLSNSKVEWRDACLAKADELGMAIVAMKVLGASIMSHNAANLVPEYKGKKEGPLAAAAIRWVMRDERVSMLNIGASMSSDVDKNLKTVTGDTKLTSEDRRILADFSRKAYASDYVKSMELA